MDALIREFKADLVNTLDQITDNDEVVSKQKRKSAFLLNRSQRGSQYRGVSKNGRKWQVMIVKGTLKKYVGTIASEHDAARIYDKYSLIIQGL